MVPGSMLMYGSSLRIETGIPRDLRMRPMEAAVMPLPRELVTPPVTKTYLGIGAGPFAASTRRVRTGGRQPVSGNTRGRSSTSCSGGQSSAPAGPTASPTTGWNLADAYWSGSECTYSTAPPEPHALELLEQLSIRAARVPRPAQRPDPAGPRRTRASSTSPRPAERRVSRAASRSSTTSSTGASTSAACPAPTDVGAGSPTWRPTRA